MGLEGKRVRIQTGEGSILLEDVQQEHECVEPAADWLVRKGLQRGRRFDVVDEDESLWSRGLGPKPAPVECTAERGKGNSS